MLLRNRSYLSKLRVITKIHVYWNGAKQGLPVCVSVYVCESLCAHVHACDIIYLQVSFFHL